MSSSHAKHLQPTASHESTDERTLKTLADKAKAHYETYEGHAANGVSKQIFFNLAKTGYEEAYNYATKRLAQLTANPYSTTAKEFFSIRFKKLKYSMRAFNCYPTDIKELKNTRQAIFDLQKSLRDLHLESSKILSQDDALQKDITRFVNGFVASANTFVTTALANLEKQLKPKANAEIEKKLLEAKQQISLHPFRAPDLAQTNSSTNITLQTLKRTRSATKNKHPTNNNTADEKQQTSNFNNTNTMNHSITPASYKKPKLTPLLYNETPTQEHAGQSQYFTPSQRESLPQPSPIEYEAPQSLTP
jgi:hypothetical protein